MLDFNRFNRSFGVTTAGVAVLLALTMIWLFMPNSINVTVLVFLGLTALSVTMLGLILLWSNGKHWKEAYATEKLFADFAHKLLKPEELGSGEVMKCVLGTLITSIKKEPVQYREFLLALRVETLEQIEDLCIKKRHRIWQEIGIERQNGENPENERRLTRLHAELQAIEATLALVGPITSIVTVNTSKPTTGDVHAHQ